MTPNTSEQPLTDEQRRVVAQPADAHTLVTAGAGAGKTHTLVHRVERLLTEMPPKDLLLLTFSRNAARQLRQRLSGLGGTCRFARVQTFDAWALDVLMECAAGREWTAASFEDRIIAASAAILDGRTDDRHDELRHVLVDEVQDLVVDRRKLVQALLDRFECGFTVVGDAAQSIYGFQVADHAQRRGEAGRFIAWLRSEFDGLEELSLTQNFRARTTSARAALEFGQRLHDATNGASDDPDTLYEQLRSRLLGALDFGSLDDPLLAHGMRSFPGTTAVLCRNNGQALIASTQLHAAVVPHGLQRAAHDRVIPAWVGMLLRRCPTSTLSRDGFNDLSAALSLPAGSSLDDMWSALQRLTPAANRRTLELSRLREVLASGRLPDDFNATPPAIVVSSFHRAKGLEFDRVLVVDPDRLRRSRDSADGGGDVDGAEEARLLYVAMTRARDDLFRLAPISTRFVRRGRKTDRWGRYGRIDWQRLGMEVLGTDVHTEEPAGTALFAADPREVQDRLSAKVMPGDPVVLERVDDGPDVQHSDVRLAEGAQRSGTAPSYLVVHDGRPIGICSSRFRTGLYRFMQRYPSSTPGTFPRTIEGLHIDTVGTVVGNCIAGEEAGLGPHGVWLAPRLTGLGDFVYDTRKDGHD